MLYGSRSLEKNSTSSILLLIYDLWLLHVLPWKQMYANSLEKTYFYFQIFLLQKIREFVANFRSCSHMDIVLAAEEG